MLPGHPDYREHLPEAPAEEEDEDIDPNGVPCCCIVRQLICVLCCCIGIQIMQQLMVTVVVSQQQKVYRNGQQFVVDNQLQHYGYHAGYAGPEFAPYGMPGSAFYDQVHAHHSDATRNPILTPLLTPHPHNTAQSTPSHRC